MEEIKKEVRSRGDADLKRLKSTDLTVGLKAIGWLYFVLSLLEGIFLIVNSKEKHIYSYEVETTVNYAYRAMGIAGIITSVIVILIRYSIARIIEQNAYLIKLQQG